MCCTAVPIAKEITSLIVVTRAEAQNAVYASLIVSWRAIIRQLAGETISLTALDHKDRRKTS